MIPYPREYLAFVERILREHPEDRRKLRELEQTIEASCRASSIPSVGGRSADTGPERVTEAKLNNRQYRFLSGRIAKIEAALSGLDKKETDFVNLMFWKDIQAWELEELLKTDVRQVRRVKTRILRKVMPHVIGDWVE